METTEYKNSIPYTSIFAMYLQNEKQVHIITGRVRTESEKLTFYTSNNYGELTISIQKKSLEALKFQEIELLKSKIELIDMIVNRCLITQFKVQEFIKNKAP